MVADLANAYSANQALVQCWNRTVTLSGDVLRITDSCTVAADVEAIFQLQVPSPPSLQQDGSIVAGNLRIVPLQPVTFESTAMQPPEFSRGHRIDLRSTAGCSFDIELRPVAASTPHPTPTATPTSSLLPTASATATASIGTSPTATPDPSQDPIEPIWSEVGTATRIKSPAQHMHFTAGAPLRILADAVDANAWMCPPGHPPYVCPGAQVRFFVDGQLVGTALPSPTDANLWEKRLQNGLPAGDHVLTVTYVPYKPGSTTGGTPINGFVPVTIHVDPPPAHGETITLSQDIVLSGSTDLDWTDKTVIGNGFKVTSDPGYSGQVIIHDSMIQGLGSFQGPGMTVTTSGSVSIQDSTFEATGAMRFGAQGSGSIVVTGNELRANNLITYVAADPAVPVILELVGSGSGAKVVQGNRIGGGMLRITGGDGWQIGGLGAGEGNVLIGPRAVLDIVNSSYDLIQGNYLRHDYHGGFSQGFNLWFEGSSDHALAEHNVIRGGSWPIQSFGGEFRYNLVIDSGHNFWRSAADDTEIHHNVFAHASGVNTGYEGVFKLYGGESGLSVYNNTFDVGGAIGGFDGPAFNLGAGTLLESVRNNLFTNFKNVIATYAGAFVSTAGGSVAAPRVISADYNGWHNPLAASSTRYLAGIVQSTAGANDVQADPQLSGDPEIPYQMSEGCIWLGNCTIGDVLAHYRDLYRPAAGSPLIGAGDPADGSGSFIGAVGVNDSDAVDLFGRIVP